MAGPVWTTWLTDAPDITSTTNGAGLSKQGLLGREPLLPKGREGYMADQGIPDVTRAHQKGGTCLSSRLRYTQGLHTALKFSDLAGAQKGQ